ncbi:MAG: hypothetical protein JEZ06_17680 [Anaerolineaceae bacterium]|nr:hypothetical protein [Anaerolineaceae bacterium]
MQPSSLTRQAALFATLLASVLILPPPLQIINSNILILLENFSLLQMWRIFNALAMLPFGIHLVSVLTNNQLFQKKGILIFFYLSAPFWMIAVYYFRNIQSFWWLRQGIMVWIVISMLVLLYLLINGNRKVKSSDPKEFRKMRSLLLLFILVLIPVLLRFFGLFFELEIIPYKYFLLSLSILPIGVGIIISRHNLFDIDALILRGLGYALISIFASLLLFYFVMVTGKQVSESNPQFRWGAIFVSMLILSIIFTPMQRWFQNSIDHWFYPERFEFSRKIQELQNRIIRVLNTKEIQQILEVELPDQIGAGWAAWVPGVLPRVPGIVDDTMGWSTLLKVENEVLGGFWLGLRESGLPYSYEEKQRLENLGQQAAIAFAYAKVLDTVEAINLDLERRVAERTNQILEQKQALTILTERRKIARDLHDSISQTLFSISLGARAIRKLAEKEPLTAYEELIILESSAQMAQQEMRSLLKELREPSKQTEVLVEDIVVKLKDHFEYLASQPGSTGHPPLLQIHYEGLESLWLNASLCDTLFQICREGFHNIIKHANVEKAKCKIHRFKKGTQIIIEDKGLGFNDKFKKDGMGLDNMRLRLEEYSGNLTIESLPELGCKLIIEIPWEEIM